MKEHNYKPSTKNSSNISNPVTNNNTSMTNISNNNKKIEDLIISSKESNVQATGIKKDPNKNISMQGNINNIEIEGKKQFIVDSNVTWKSGLNKQGNIDLAILAQKSNQTNKKNTQNILEMVGDVGSVEILEVKEKEKSKEDKLSKINPKEEKNVFVEPEPLKEINQIEVPLSKDNPLKGRTSNIEDAFNFDPNNVDINDEEYQRRLKQSQSLLDNQADISDFQKWKNFKRTSIDQPIPDLSQVKSKINTGLFKIKTLDSNLHKETEDLKKKYESLQKEKDNKLKDYREMLIKMRNENANDQLNKNVSC